MDRVTAIKALAGTIAIISFIGGIALLLFWVKPEPVQVTAHQWRIEQQIEDFQTRALEGWDETVPSDARNIQCRSRQRGSHQVYLGESCTGIAPNLIWHSEYASMPDFDQYCVYQADRWDYLTSYVNEGGMSDAVIAPEPSTLCSGVSEIGCQRYGRQVRTFTVVFARQSDNSAIICDYDRSFWESLREGNTYQMTFGGVFNEARCGINP